MAPLTEDDCLAGIRALEGFCAVPFNQSTFFAADQQGLLGNGVCNAICLDWVRRQLFKNKPSFANSKKADPASLATRLQHKGPRLAETSPHINALSMSARGTVQTLVELGNKWAAFAGATVADVANGEARLVGYEVRTEADQQHGRAMFDAALRLCLQPPTNRRDEVPMLTPDVRRLLGEGREEEADRAAPRLTGGYQRASFIIQLSGKRMKPALRAMKPEERDKMESFDLFRGFKNSGHAVALRVEREAQMLYYMDPNIGEYNFPIAQRDKLLDLFHYVWNFTAIKEAVVYTKYEIAYFGV